VNIEYKFVLPERIVPPLKVEADKPAEKFELPDAVTELKLGDATTLTLGKVDEPPIVVLDPAVTPFTNRPPMFVEPLNIVPPLNVEADNPAEKLLDPLAVTELKLGDATTLIVGFKTVPPVVMFEPCPTEATPDEPKGANIAYKFVLPERIVPPLNVEADKPAEKLLDPDAVIEANEGDDARIIVGFVAVPPVDKFPFAPTD